MKDSEPITEGQMTSLRGLIDAKDEAQRLWIISQMVEREIKALDRMTVGEWRILRDYAYPNWRDQDWKTINPEFTRDLAGWRQQYYETVTGQQRLF